MDKDGYHGYDIPNAQLKVLDPRPNTIRFFDTTKQPNREVLRIAPDGITAHPDIFVDETADVVLRALDGSLKGMMQREYERGVIDGQAAVKEGYERRIGELKHYEDLCNHANYQIGLDTVEGKHYIVVMRDNGDGTTTMVATTTIKENT